MIPNKTISVALLVLIFLLPGLAKADDESSALEKFNRSVQSADPRQVEASLKQNRTNPPSKDEVEKIVNAMADAAVDVVDEAAQFRKNFPQSKQLAQVHASMVDTLATDFAGKGFPVPKNRAAELEAGVRSLLKETPNDPFLYMVLVRVAKAMPIAKGHDMYVELSSDSIPEPARGMAKQGLLTLERVGLPLDIHFTALDGRQINLADLRGKVVLVDFWATTCVPCLREFPDLKRLYEKYHTNGFEIVGISLDSDKAALTRFIEKEKISWPQFYEPSGETNRLATQYGVAGIPVVWLVDKHGALRHLDARTDQETKVEALLKE
jgi:peroxiredoxin